MDAHYQHCANHLRQYDYGRYIACLYLGEEVRQAAFAIFAFNHKVSQIPALISEPMPGEIRIQWWRDIIADRDELSGDPIARALQQTITKYNLPTEILERFLSARIFDLYNDPMPDKAVLETYLGETYSALFLLLAISNSSTNAGPTINAVSATNYGDACGHGGVFTGIVELLKALPLHEHQQHRYFPADLSSHQRLEKFPAPDRPDTVNGDWLSDIGEYALTHHRAAMDAISGMPGNFRTLFLGLALSKLELNRIRRNGITLATPYLPPSRLRINWHLWNEIRSQVL